MRAGRPELVVTGPEVPVQPTPAPDSKPGLTSRLLPVGGVVGDVVGEVVGDVVTDEQTSVPGATLTADQVAATTAHSLLLAPYRSLAALMVLLRALG